MRVTGLTPQDLKAYGIHDVQEVVYNPDYDTLYQEELNPALEGYERGVLTNLGAIAVDTGIFTGRSPKDKYIVRDETTRDTLWWADKGKGKNDNKPLSPETWQHLKGLVTHQLSGKRLFIVDAFCGANADTRLSVRFITEVAWQAHFVKNMFIRPTDEELKNFTPDFIVMNGAKCTNPQWKEQGLNSENFVAFNLTERIQLIGGTWYGGEMKKGMFSVMNYLLPLRGIASMHCSANVGEKGDVAVFFGLFAGKSLGIFLFTYIFVRLRLATMPEGVSKRNLFGVSMLGGIGFTVALFIANLSFAGMPDVGVELLNQAKLGVFAGSFISGLCGYLILKKVLPKNYRDGQT